jgi:hypothetical protein
MSRRETVLICGSRTWTDPAPIRAAVAALASGSIVLVGGATGADRVAEHLARERGDLEVRVFAADWRRHGRRAGVLRNLRMLDQRPDRVLAFQIGDSPGTTHTIGEANRRGIPVRLEHRP